MNVSAIIVTRGNIDLRPVLDSLPPEWEQVVWTNDAGDGHATCSVRKPGKHERDRGAVTCTDTGPDLSVYGRYAAIEYASHDLIYVQDDDCVVSDPQEVAATCAFVTRASFGDTNHAVCNMPEPWRSNPFYARHALVGFGACFHRDAPRRAFERWERAVAQRGGTLEGITTLHEHSRNGSLFYRTCDVVFTALTPRVLVNVPHTSFDYAWGDDRMWKQPSHQDERQRMLDLALRVADAGS